MLDIAAMRALFALVVFVLAASALAVEKAAVPVVATFYEKPYDITTSVRTNGCKMELRRYPDTYTKNKPNLLGFWVQDLFVGERLILRIQHSAVSKEQSLVIEHDSDYGVLQVDRDLDGKYEILVVASRKDQSLKDVMFVATDGSLRHSTPEEFEIWQHRERENKRSIEAADKAIRTAIEKTSDSLKK